MKLKMLEKQNEDNSVGVFNKRYQDYKEQRMNKHHLIESKYRELLAEYKREPD